MESGQVVEYIDNGAHLLAICIMMKGARIAALSQDWAGGQSEYFKTDACFQ